jgi:hypothetical protein
MFFNIPSDQEHVEHAPVSFGDRLFFLRFDDYILHFTFYLFLHLHSTFTFTVCILQFVTLVCVACDPCFRVSRTGMSSAFQRMQRALRVLEAMYF